ncbi:MAG: ACR3 family arsenite efflux transporter, partial [Anaerolineales bacterium]|nr:ACR3 family arsenite efflux transporter [Anaerolineales bacterium]
MSEHKHEEGRPLPECIDGTIAPKSAEEACEIATGEKKHLSIFDRYLSIWVALCIIVGTLVGYFIPGTAKVLDKLSTARISWPIAVLIWLMIYPMMLKIDFKSILQAGKKPKGVVVTTVSNWLVKPFTMYAFASLFFLVLFKPWISHSLGKQYLAGAILLGAAPCTAMVFVWSQLVKGDANYTLVQVSVNDLIMVVAFAPIAAFLLGVTNVTVPWETLLLSTVLYVVLPLVAGMLTRQWLLRRGPAAVTGFVAALKPWSVIGLIATVVLLFGFQAETIIRQPLVILLIAVPLVLQSYGIFFIAWWGAKWLKLPHNVAGPACLIGTSNFFELAVAVAIS